LPRKHRPGYFGLLPALLVAVAWLALLGTALADAMPPRVLAAREGRGYLEQVGPQLVLHLRGTPAEMGRQHGVLLRQHIRGNFANLMRKAQELAGGNVSFGWALMDTVWGLQSRYLPDRFEQELRALADGAGLPYEQLRRGNTIPEFFHCSGFALFGGATKDGRLYHWRILDYGVDWGLQEHAVVIIAEPKGLIPFANVGYAGFIGSVTGMNLRKLGFGEMGGGGVGKWSGTPMAFLVRRGLEEARTLDQATKLFAESKRTCEYHYVVSDAKVPGAVRIWATPEQIEFVGPNKAKEPMGTPIRDGVLLSAGGRYRLLVKRVQEKWGSLDAAGCLELMRRPLAMESCLHAALMAPGTGELWVAHATAAGGPASEQPYTYLSIPELMAGMP